MPAHELTFNLEKDTRAEVGVGECWGARCDGKRVFYTLFSSSDDGMPLSICDMASTTPDDVTRYTVPHRFHVFHTRGNRIIGLLDDDQHHVHCYELGNPEPVYTIEIVDNWEEQMGITRKHGSGDYFLLCYPAEVRVYRTATGEMIERFDLPADHVPMCFKNGLLVLQSSDRVILATVAPFTVLFSKECPGGFKGKVEPFLTSDGRPAIHARQEPGNTEVTVMTEDEVRHFVVPRNHSIDDGAYSDCVREVHLTANPDIILIRFIRSLAAYDMHRGLTIGSMPLEKSEEVMETHRDTFITREYKLDRDPVLRLRRYSIQQTQ